MSSHSSAKEQILGSIRSHLGVRNPDRLEALAPRATASSPREFEEKFARFATLLTNVGGRVTRAATEAEAVARLAELISANGAERVGASDDPLVRRLLSGVSLVEFDDRPGLLKVPLGVTSAQWGIADTGSVVLDSRRERHRLVSLLPPVHVVVLPKSRMVVGIADALLAAHHQDALDESALTFITGPSRTADIELTLVIGVHGPKEFEVIVLEDGVMV